MPWNDVWLHKLHQRESLQIFRNSRNPTYQLIRNPTPADADREISRFGEVCGSDDILDGNGICKIMRRI
ncbi:hypothetical protein CEXT_349411 [Caerostris extrusa]|uniref:Uncharacterized protein n=1 Tax=Caerostris extrusa TaxID=172846 RepID=A0AAV4X6A6_CAEEX|nr:hypothetical protein CEXT_349411 [Caerostris extrusa]